MMGGAGYRKAALQTSAWSTSPIGDETSAQNHTITSHTPPTQTEPLSGLKIAFDRSIPHFLVILFFFLLQFGS